MQSDMHSLGERQLSESRMKPQDRPDSPRHVSARKMSSANQN